MFCAHTKSRTIRVICIVAVGLGAAIMLVLALMSPAPAHPIPLQIRYTEEKEMVWYHGSQNFKPPGLYFTNCSATNIRIQWSFEVKTESGWTNAPVSGKFTPRLILVPDTDLNPGILGYNLPKVSQPWRVHAEVSEPLTGLSAAVARLRIGLRHPLPPPKGRAPIDRTPWGHTRDLWSSTFTNATQSTLNR